MNVSEVISQTPTTTTIGIDATPAALIESVSSGSTEAAASEIPWSSIIRYGLIILILAFLGINIFGVFAKATESTTGFLRPLLATLGYGVGETVKQTTNVTAEGAKTAVDVAAGSVDDAVTLLQKSVGTKGVQFNRIDDTKTTTSSALENATSKHVTQEPEADSAGSVTQQSKSLPKSGYCYIGEDRGFRSCIKVNEGDMCMSGDIFPSKDICVSPSLRE